MLCGHKGIGGGALDLEHLALRETLFSRTCADGITGLGDQQRILAYEQVDGTQRTGEVGGEIFGSELQGGFLLAAIMAHY